MQMHELYAFFELSIKCIAKGYTLEYHIIKQKKEVDEICRIVFL